MTDTELEGIGPIEEVPLPFHKQKPQYRIDLRVNVTDYAMFSTWKEPGVYTEDDDAASDLIRQVLDGFRDDVDVDFWGRVEQKGEDGSWGPVDFAAIEERCTECGGDYREREIDDRGPTRVRECVDCGHQEED